MVREGSCPKLLFWAKRSMKTRKRVPTCFLAWDFDSEEVYINKQAKLGWQLVKGNLWSQEYVRSDVEYRYRLDYFQQTRKSEEEIARYFDMHADMGWEFINSTFNGWNYFRKKYVPGTPEEDYELYTDNESLQGMLKRFIGLLRIFQLLFLFNMFTPVVQMIENFDLTELLLAGMQFMGLCLMESGVISLKRKRVGKKPRWTVGRVGSYALWVACVLCICSYFAAMPSMFRDPVYYTSFNGSLMDKELEMSHQFTVEKERNYTVEIDVSVGDVPVQVILSAADNGEILVAGSGTQVEIKEKLRLEKGEYQIDIISSKGGTTADEKQEQRKIYIRVE